MTASPKMPELKDCPFVVVPVERLSQNDMDALETDAT